MDKQWYIFRVSPGKETKVGSAIVAVDPGSVYIPQRRVSRYNRRHRVMISRSEVLFPGYLFVETAEAHRLLSVPCDALLGAVRTPSKDLAVLTFPHLIKLHDAEKRAQRMADQKNDGKLGAPKVKVGDKVDAMNILKAIVKEVDGDDVTLETKMFGSTRTVATKVTKLVTKAA